MNLQLKRLSTTNNGRGNIIALSAAVLLNGILVAYAVRDAGNPKMRLSFEPSETASSLSTAYLAELSQRPPMMIDGIDCQTRTLETAVDELAGEIELRERLSEFLLRATTTQIIFLTADGHAGRVRKGCGVESTIVASNPGVTILNTLAHDDAVERFATSKGIVRTRTPVADPDEIPA